jgi:hypothetical protein
LTAKDIYCVTGDYDHVEEVLRKLEIPHTIVPHDELGRMLRKISPDAIVVLNCTGDPVGDANARRLRDFVQRGGYLFTSDWQLSLALEPAFPGRIAKDGETGSHEFRIRPAPGAAKHPYLRDVFPAKADLARKMRWKIDGASYTVRYLKRGATRLIVCDELGAMYQSNTVACTFRHGKGSVLHVLGHFEKQQDKVGDRFALLQLFVNFVVEKQKQRRAPAP